MQRFFRVEALIPPAQHDAALINLRRIGVGNIYMTTGGLTLSGQQFPIPATMLSFLVQRESRVLEAAKAIRSVSPRGFSPRITFASVTELEPPEEAETASGERLLPDSRG